MDSLGGDTRLLEAASLGQTDLVLQLLEENGQGLHSFKDQDGQTALHLAAIAGHIDTGTALTLNGADVNAQDFTGHTALQRAASEGHLDVIKHLVSRGALIDHQDEVHGNTALHEAAWKGFSKTVEFLCKSKSNYYLRNRGGFSPLHLCCQNGHNETCRMLLRAGCKPNIKNNYGDTPLHTAARYGHAGVARILISASCNPNLQNKNGDSPLHIASAMGRRKLARILLESAPDLTLKNQQKETPLEIARRKQHDEIAEMITNPPPAKPTPNRVMPNGGIEIVDGVEVIDDGNNHHPQQQLKIAKGNKKKGKHKHGGHHHHRHNKAVPISPHWSPYGCHYYPDPTEFPDPDPASLPDEPLKQGEQYYLDLAGNIRKGPVSNGYTCYCAPLINRVERRMDRNKRDMFRHLDHTHGKLANRINHLEKKTRDQLSNLSNSVKETFAQERLECHDRMGRRAIRDRINIERQQAVRDLMLRGDLSAWLEKRVTELEASTAHKHSADAAFMRTLLRSSRRRKGSRAFWAEVEGGTLRRAASEECLPDDEKERQAEDEEDILLDSSILSQPLSNRHHQELRVSDHPNLPPSQPTAVRVRRNSAGDGEAAAAALMGNHRLMDQLFVTAPTTNNGGGLQNGLVPSPSPLYQNSLAVPSPSMSGGSTGADRGNLTSYSTQSESHHSLEGSRPPVHASSEYNVERPLRPPPVPPIKPPLRENNHIYQNFHHQMMVQRPIPVQALMGPPKVPPPYRPPPAQILPGGGGVTGDLTSYNVMNQHPPLLGFSKTTSDGGRSHDSHNDSGYCPRPGGSGGPSPSLSGSHGRPDSRGPHDLMMPSSLIGGEVISHRPTAPPTTTSTASVAPRIRQLQQQLSLARINSNKQAEVSAKGSLV